LPGFEVLATGEIPGQPLNQFLWMNTRSSSVATTVGERIFRATKSANDVYVLDKDLRVVGSVQDLGLGERIYSARFVEDKGYLVTFRQTDPFYVLDLANTKQPQVKDS